MYNTGDLFFTKCWHCGNKIIVDIPKGYEKYKKHGVFTCNECVPKNSILRNDIDESTLLDITDELFSDYKDILNKWQ